MSFRQFLKSKILYINKGYLWVFWKGYMIQSGIFNGMNIYSTPMFSFNGGFEGNDIYSLSHSIFLDNFFVNSYKSTNYNIFASNFKAPSVNYSKPAKVVEAKASAKGVFSNESLEKIDAISSKLNCTPEDLKTIINAESSGKATAVNRKSGATGLIQFLPSTAKWLGTSTEELKQMPAEKQLDYVEKYLTLMKKSAGFSASDKLDASTLYCLVFSPAHAKKASQAVLYSEGSEAYKLNKGLDKSGKGYITKADLGHRLDEYSVA